MAQAQSVTPLRQRMLENMKLRNMVDGTSRRINEKQVVGVD